MNRDLPKEMAENAAVIELLRDPEVAYEFYRALCGVVWIANRPTIPEEDLIMGRLRGIELPPKWWAKTWVGAAMLVANVRHTVYKTEDIDFDYYLSGGEGDISEKVRVCFADMGWDPIIIPHLGNTF